MECIENRTFDEIHIGDAANLSRRLTVEDIKLFAVMSGNINPAHVDEDYAKSSRFHEVVSHVLWGGSLISTLLGTQLPGPGVIYKRLTFDFRRPVYLGDLLTVTVTVRDKHTGNHELLFDCQGVNQDGEVAISGEASVIAPTEKVKRPRTIMPEVHLAERTHLHRLMEATKERKPLHTAVVHPVERHGLLGAIEAAKAGLITPVLIGPESKIRTIAEAGGVDLAPYDLVSVAHSHAAAEKAVELARAGEVDALMKGSLHTDELMQAVLTKEKGLRTERRISHVFAFDVPTYPRPLFLTDAAINIYPTLEDKRDIVQNAIDLARALRIETPKVAILSAVETITRKIQSTLEAAALCKMADRGQITGGILDGPLAFDNAISEAAARTKGIVSPVAGKADILVVPDLESGNMLAKQLEYLADAQGAAIVLGARIPIVLTSRADDAITRMASCALAMLVADHAREVRS